MKRKLLPIITACILGVSLLGGCARENSEKEQATAPGETEEKDLTTIRPQDDFYGAVNAERLLQTVLPYGETAWGTFNEVDEEATEEVFGLIRELSSSKEEYPAGSPEYLIKQVYAQGMTFTDQDEFFSEIQGLCEKVKICGSISELFSLWTSLYRSYGANPPFLPLVRQNYFKAGEYALVIDQASGLCGYSFENIADSDEDCISMKNYIRDMLLSEGYDKETADSRAKEAVSLSLSIAHATDYTAGKVANPFAAFTFVKEEELNRVFSNLDPVITLFFGKKENPYGGWYVKDLNQLIKINELLYGENLEQWKTILIAELVSANMDFLSTEADSLMAYASKEDREYAVCMKIASKLFYKELSSLYAKKYYTADKEEAVKMMCEELRESYRELIGKADWLTENGREALTKKLNNMRFLLPDAAILDNSLETDLIKEDYAKTIQAVREQKYDEDIQNIGRKFDMTIPQMLTYEVNACYNPNNSVTITAAIMHAPFFDPQAEKGTNLGGLGDVIGHEIGHGFDTTCMDYNEKGEYDPEWLCEADRQALSERAEAMQAYFSTYTILDIYHIDGKKTSGENYADLGAMECIVNLLKDDKEQLKNFFESYALTEAEIRVDSAAISALSTDEHSPGRIRVNATFSCCPAFYEIYEVKEGDGMYRAPGERVSRW